jgi:hypothetical protein
MFFTSSTSAFAKSHWLAVLGQVSLKALEAVSNFTYVNSRS